jgi:hypothetical protein
VSNPVQSLGDESLTDQKDSDAAIPAAAYYDVGLTHLHGSGHLRGGYADVYSSTGNLAFSPTNTFRYRRHADEFEQVMACYWITQAQTYIHNTVAAATAALRRGRCVGGQASLRRPRHPDLAHRKGPRLGRGPFS